MISNASPKNREILVTGAGGFIGRRVVGEFAAAGRTLRALLGPGDLPLEDAANPGVLRDVKQLDLAGSDSIDSIVDGCDTVVHLAGPPSVSRSFTEPANCARVHVCGTIRLVERACALGVRRFVYVSSAEVYGRPRMNPVAEGHPLEPRSPYGAAKITAERFIEAMAAAGEMQAVIIRPFSVYGPGLSPYSLIGTIIRQAIAGEAVRLADLRPVRDYCYVGDLVAAIARACDVPMSAATTMKVNVGTGHGTSIAELVEHIGTLLNRKLSVEETGLRDRPADDDIFELMADPRLACEALGWQPATTLNEGLQATLAAQGAA